MIGVTNSETHSLEHLLRCLKLNEDPNQSNQYLTGQDQRPRHSFENLLRSSSIDDIELLYQNQQHKTNNNPFIGINNEIRSLSENDISYPYYQNDLNINFSEQDEKTSMGKGLFYLNQINKLYLEDNSNLEIGPKVRIKQHPALGTADFMQAIADQENEIYQLMYNRPDFGIIPPKLDYVAPDLTANNSNSKFEDIFSKSVYGHRIRSNIPVPNMQANERIFSRNNPQKDIKHGVLLQTALNDSIYMGPVIYANIGHGNIRPLDLALAAQITANLNLNKQQSQNHTTNNNNNNTHKSTENFYNTSSNEFSFNNSHNTTKYKSCNNYNNVSFNKYEKSADIKSENYNTSTHSSIGQNYNRMINFANYNLNKNSLINQDTLRPIVTQSYKPVITDKFLNQNSGCNHELCRCLKMIGHKQKPFGGPDINKLANVANQYMAIKKSAQYNTNNPFQIKSRPTVNTNETFQTDPLTDEPIKKIKKDSIVIKLSQNTVNKCNNGKPE